MPECRFLKYQHIPAALRLSTLAGWNQLEADWHRLIEIPGFLPLAMFKDDRLVATGTATHYVRGASWIGMILVDPEQRGQGLGTDMMKALIDRAREWSRGSVGLDATDMGRPLYLKLGFKDVCPIQRWSRPAGSLPIPRSPGADPLLEIRAYRSDDWDALSALDWKAVGVERAQMFNVMAKEKDIDWRVAVKRGELIGFAMTRPGRNARFIGPLVAASTSVAERLLDAAVNDAWSDEPKFIDAFDRPQWHDALLRRGFTVSRVLTRMVLTLENRPAQTMTSDIVFAGAGFELG